MQMVEDEQSKQFCKNEMQKKQTLLYHINKEKTAKMAIIFV
jgi:hypothetical protein